MGVAKKQKTSSGAKIKKPQKRPRVPSLFGRRFGRPALFAAIFALVGVGTLLVSLAAAPSGEIINKQNGKCLENWFNAQRNTNFISTYRCDGNNQAQKWAMAGDGSIRTKENYCLDVPYATKKVGTRIWLWQCNGTVAQKWEIRSDGTIRNPNSSLCLEITATDTFLGGPNVLLQTCNGNNQRQIWTVPTAPLPLPTLPPTNPPAPAPTPSPTPAPASTPATSPSKEAMPGNDIPGWRQVFTDDFTRPAALGSWGSECDHLRTVYTGLASAALGAANTQWRSYPQCFSDTYQKRPYRADQVLSVHDGVLDFHLHKVDGQPAGANPSPIIKNGSQYQLYGRYAARFRVTNASQLSDYYAAWLLWPQTENWNGSGPGDGEIDFPEGSLNGAVGGFNHCLYNNSYNCASANTGGVNFSDWHTYVIEWTPEAIRFFLDGRKIPLTLGDDRVVDEYTDHANIPNVPMRWQLQTETNGPGTSNAEGHLEVDWVAVYERM